MDKMFLDFYKDFLSPYLGPHLEFLRVHINQSCRGTESWQIIAFTFGFTMWLVWTWMFLFKPDQSKYQSLELADREK